MAHSLCMLAAILAIVLASPFVACLIPGRPVPEVVFFVFAGAPVGPFGAGVVVPDEGLALVSRIGLGLPFLMRATSLTRTSSLARRVGTPACAGRSRWASRCWRRRFWASTS